MSLYDKPVRHLMREMVRELDLGPEDSIDRSEVVDWFASNYPLVKQSTVSAHLIRMSTNAPSRLHHNIQSDGSDDLFFQMDRSRYRLFKPEADPAPIRSSADLEAEYDRAAPEAQTGSSEFAYEHDLRDYLAKNLSILEPGLRLFDDEGVTGVEFPVGGRFVDILAVDDKGHYVIIELKVSRGYDRVVGQLLRYIAWIEQHHADANQEVRGIILAKEITEDLKLACSRINGVQLFEYELSVTVEQVT